MESEQNRGWELFIALCRQPSMHKKFNELFGLLLTSEERSSLSTRCLLIQALLEDKMTQREIAEEFNISISKITRGSNALKLIDSQLRKDLIKFFTSK